MRDIHIIKICEALTKIQIKKIDLEKEKIVGHLVQKEHEYFPSQEFLY